MSDKSWYRKSDWDPEAQEIFKKKIKRARSSKVSYTLTKARVLYGTGDEKKMAAAKEMLETTLSKYREEPFDVPDMAQTLARWYLKDEDFVSAEKSIDGAWDGFEIAHSDLDYEILHAKNRESLDYLWRHLSEVSRSGEYRISSYDWYDLIEVVSADNPDTIEYKQTEGDLFRYIPELSAYLGQVLVNEFVGRWEERRPLMESPVILEGGEIDSFLIAYYVVVYRFPLNRVIDGINTVKDLLKEKYKT